MNNEEKRKLSFFGVRNCNFSVENITSGFTYSTVEYARRRKNIYNDDDGTVRQHLSNLNCTSEQYIDLSINHRNRVYCCIKFVLVFALFTIISS